MARPPLDAQPATIEDDDSANSRHNVWREGSMGVLDGPDFLVDGFDALIDFGVTLPFVFAEVAVSCRACCSATSASRSVSKRAAWIAPRRSGAV
ncbi:hypothetical protein PCC82_21800 [Agrobacterium deltaense]